MHHDFREGTFQNLFSSLFDFLRNESDFQSHFYAIIFSWQQCKYFFFENCNTIDDSRTNKHDIFEKVDLFLTEGVGGG